jgi:hypothetical protein
LQATSSINKKGSGMKIIKLLITILSLQAVITSHAEESIRLNDKATGKNAVQFLQKMDDKTDGYVRALRRGSKVDWDALTLIVRMNQSANLEAQLDLLIAELRKNNHLLSMHLTK